MSRDWMMLSSLNDLLLLFDDIEEEEDIGISVGIRDVGGNPSNRRLKMDTPGLCIDH